MQRKNRSKKIISAMLAFSMGICAIPPMNVLADVQTQVTGVVLTDNSSTTNYSTSYTIGVQWEDPQKNGEHTGAAITYDVLYKRGVSSTGGEDYYAANFPGTADKSYVIPPKAVNGLTNGSIYAFRVDATHLNKVVTTDADGNPVDTYVPSKATGAPSLYLTDIPVEAIGAGNSLTVTWENPKFDNSNVFDGYRIYYRKSTGTTMNTIYDAPYKQIKTNEASVTPDGKLKYTITDTMIVPLEYYDVAIMPTVGASNYPLRGDASTNYVGTNTVSVGTKQYAIYYPAAKTRQYATNKAYVSFPIHVEEFGSSQVRIFWDKISTTKPIKQINVWQAAGGSGADKQIGTISSSAVFDINYAFADRPLARTSYYLEIVYADGLTMKSDIAVFNPVFNDFSPYRPNIVQLEDNGVFPLRLDVTWKAFTRAPYGEEKETFPNTGIYLDKGVLYDFYISDSLTSFSDPKFYAKGPIINTVNASSLTEEPRTTDPLNPYVYSTAKNNINLSSYMSFNETTGDYVKVPFVDNKVYYVRVIARLVSDVTKTSLPSIASIYINPVNPIPTNPQMLASPPLTIKEIKNDKGVNTIDIQWDTKWLEVYDDATGTWNSLAGVADGKLVLGDAAKTATNKVLPLEAGAIDNIVDDKTAQNAIEQVQSKLRTLLAIPDGEPNVPVRVIDLKNAEYEIHTAKFDLAAAAGTNTTVANPYMAYINKINTDKTAWTKIKPNGEAPHLTFTVTDENAPNKGKLANNTAYIIFLRPVVNGIAAYYPSYVAGTTLNYTGPLNIIPTVPTVNDASKPVSGVNIDVVPQTDTELTVFWEYNENVTYEISFSDLLQNYPKNGQKIAVTDKNSVIKSDKTTGKKYVYMTLTGLFPDTTYYVWVRAIAGKNSSDYSNPVFIKTLDLLPPSPPSGLGLASADSISAYNKEKSTNLVPSGKDYLVLEWMLSPEEKKAAATSSVKGGSAEVLTSNVIVATYLAKFNGLLPNKEYYARAKTVLTVTKGAAAGASTRSLSYVVQLSPTPDFVDFIEITIPPLAAYDPDKNPNMKRKESAWTATIKLVTNKSTDEYDGDKDPNRYPLPAEDYEITYDKETDTLKFTFRSHKVGADGNNDNGVDQRFISRLVQGKVFSYNIDLTSYEGITPKNRVVEMPYSIFSAFDERKISFSVKADSLYYTLLPGALQTAEVKATKDVGKNSVAKLTFNANASGTPNLGYSELYLGKPQNVTAALITPTKTINLQSLEVPAKVEFAIDKASVSQGRNVSAYYKTANTVGWEMQNSAYNSLTGIVSSSTKAVGNYSVIAKMTPSNDPTDKYSADLGKVNKNLLVTDMGVFAPYVPVEANQFNRIVHAIATNKKSVAMNEAISDTEVQTLGKAGMLVSGTTISREAGINTLVRLYELKTKTSIKGYPTEASSRYPDTKDVDPKFKTAVLKAERLGLLGDSAKVSPKELLTFGEMYRILGYVFDDIE